jgi:hypothetical protein
LSSLDQAEPGHEKSRRNTKIKSDYIFYRFIFAGLRPARRQVLKSSAWGGARHQNYKTRKQKHFPLAGASRACQTLCYRKSEDFMAENAKRMGRPPGEPSKVVRLPLPVAALAKRLT